MTTLQTDRPAGRVAVNRHQSNTRYYKNAPYSSSFIFLPPCGRIYGGPWARNSTDYHSGIRLA